MTEPETGHERWRQAERALGAHADEPIKPVEETDAVADAVEDETPVTGLEQLAARQAHAAAEEHPDDDDLGPQAQEQAATQARHGEETEPTRHTTPERLAHESEAAATGEETEPTKHTTPERLAQGSEAGPGRGERGTVA